MCHSYKTVCWHAIFNDRIGTGWEGEQYLMGTTWNPEWPIVLVSAHLGCAGVRAVKQRVCCCCREVWPSLSVGRQLRRTAQLPIFLPVLSLAVCALCLYVCLCSRPPHYGCVCLLSLYSNVLNFIMRLCFLHSCSGVVVEDRTHNREVAGLTHTRSTASNLEQVANLLCAQANSASYPQWTGNE